MKTKKGSVNYRLRLDPLGGFISPAECKINVKSNSVSLTLKKADANKTWVDVLYKAKQAQEKGKEASKDPQTGLMDMMKKMYDDGDDTMKKTIGEAWTKAQHDGANK